MTAPVLLTRRLRLRRHRVADIDARAAIHADADHLAHVGGAQGREECWQRIQRYAGHWAMLGHGLFAVEERDGGRLVGEVGLARFERGLGPDFDPAPEAAWVIAADVAGRGYAGEAMAAAIAWHESTVAPARFVCVIAHGNGASLRLAERLGFRPFAERPYKGAPRLLLERAATQQDG